MQRSQKLGPTLAAVALSLAAVSSCALNSPADSPGPPEASAAVAGARAGAVESDVLVEVRSERGSYRLSLPQDYSFVPAGAFDSTTLGKRGRAGVDVYSSGESTVLVSATLVPTRETLAHWSSLLTEVMHDQAGCRRAPSAERTTLAGERADLLTYARGSCASGDTVLAATTLHAGRGYVVVWLGGLARADAATRTPRSRFETLLRTFAFLNECVVLRCSRL